MDNAGKNAVFEPASHEMMQKRHQMASISRVHKLDRRQPKEFAFFDTTIKISHHTGTKNLAISKR